MNNSHQLIVNGTKSDKQIKVRKTFQLYCKNCVLVYTAANANRATEEKIAALNELFDQVATVRNKCWAALEAQASCRTAAEATAAEARTAEQTIVLAGAKAAAMGALITVVRVLG